MVKAYKTKYLLFYVCIFLLGCDDFLSRNPGAMNSFAEQLASEEGILEAVNGIYAELEDFKASKQYLYADLMGGNLTFNPNFEGNNTGVINIPSNIDQIYNFSDMARTSDFSGIYNDGYSIIGAINVVLDFIDQSDITSVTKERVKSEITGIRAYVHFELTNLYGQQYTFTEDGSHHGIAYIKATLTPGVDFPKRLSISDTYDMIITDLQDAINTGDGQPAISYYPAYAFFNKDAMNAILARINLYRENWEESILMCNNVINGNIDLTSRVDYVQGWKNRDLPISEILWELPPSRNSDGDVGFSLSNLFGYILLIDQQLLGYRSYSMSKDLIDLYSNTDIRKAQLVTAFSILTINENDEEIFRNFFFTEKFQEDPGTPIIRLSEVYLMRAEANAQLGNLDEALDDLNIIRLRADAEATPLFGLSQKEVIDAILLERRKELALEGHLFYDLMRYKQDIVRVQGCVSSRCNVSYPSNFFVLPIPEETILVNENMEQNEGY